MGLKSHLPSSFLYPAGVRVISTLDSTGNLSPRTASLRTGHVRVHCVPRNEGLPQNFVLLGPRIYWIPTTHPLNPQAEPFFLRVGLLKETPSPNRESASTIFLLQMLLPPGLAPVRPSPGAGWGGQCLRPLQLASSPAGHGNLNLGGRDAAFRGSAERHDWSQLVGWPEQRRARGTGGGGRPRCCRGGGCTPSSTVCSPAARARLWPRAATSEGNTAPPSPAGGPRPIGAASGSPGTLLRPLQPTPWENLSRAFLRQKPTPPEELSAVLKGLGRLMGDWDFSST